MHRDGQKDPVVSYYLTANTGRTVVMDASASREGSSRAFGSETPRSYRNSRRSRPHQRLAQAYLEQHGSDREEPRPVRKETIARCPSPRRRRHEPSQIWERSRNREMHEYPPASRRPRCTRP